MDAPSWGVSFNPGFGQRLAKGTYVDADLIPYDASRPSLAIRGNGRSCNHETGRFVVTNVTYLEHRIKTLDASFEQRCEGAEAALRGEVHIVHPDLVEPLQTGLDVDSQARFDADTGGVTVRGTVTCNRAARIYVSATLTQQPGARTGSIATFADCSTTAAAWQGTATSESLPFTSGVLDLVAIASASDDERYRDTIWARHTGNLQVTQDRSGHESDIAPGSGLEPPAAIGVAGTASSSSDATTTSSSSTSGAPTPSSSPSRRDSGRTKPRRLRRLKGPRSRHAPRHVAARGVSAKRRGGGSQHRPSRRR